MPRFWSPAKITFADETGRTTHKSASDGLRDLNRFQLGPKILVSAQRTRCDPAGKARNIREKCQSRMQEGGKRTEKTGFLAEGVFRPDMWAVPNNFNYLKIDGRPATTSVHTVWHVPSRCKEPQSIAGHTGRTSGARLQEETAGIFQYVPGKGATTSSARFCETHRMLGSQPNPS